MTMYANNAMESASANTMPVVNPALAAFELPDMTAGEFDAQDLADDMDGMTMAFPRVKIPGAGMLQFELPSGDPERPAYTGTLTGVILFSHATCAFWPGGKDEDDNAPPLCFSVDGKQGIGEPGGLCATCEFNKYDTAVKGKGKACKNMRVLYLLRSGDAMPIQLALPPTSLKPWRDFYGQAFGVRRRAVFGSLVEIGLKKANNGSNDYSVATFRLLGDFTGEKLAQVKAYAADFRNQVKSLNVQRAATQAEMLREAQESDEVPALPEIVGNQHGISVVDGEREALPA